MPKILKLGIKLLTIVLYVACLGALFMFFEGFDFLISGIKGTAGNSILRDQHYLITQHYLHVSQTTISGFPNLAYGIMMAVGVFTLVFGALKMFLAGLKLLDNISQKKYFSTVNVLQLRKILVAQILLIISDTLIAGGNQMVLVILHRMNTGYLDTTFSDLLSDFTYLIIIGIVYYIYKKSIEFKQENELTI